VIDELKRGIHYTGNGTIDDPFVFSKGVDYYAAFAKLCNHLGLDAGRRRLISTSSGRLLDAVPDAQGRMYYFAPPINVVQES
jgi:hypothetical protein